MLISKGLFKGKSTDNLFQHRSFRTVRKRKRRKKEKKDKNTKKYIGSFFI